MSSQVDYSAEDWLLLREFPFHLILGAIASDTHGPLGGAARESVIAGRHLVAEGLEKRDNALIAALLCDYASEGEDRTPEIELDSPEQRLSAVTQALSEAIRVRELLAERDDGIEAREYREWVFAAARAATRATKSGGIAGFGRKLVSDDEARYLEHAAVALGLEPVEAE